MILEYLSERTQHFSTFTFSVHRYSKLMKNEHFSWKTQQSWQLFDMTVSSTNRFLDRSNPNKAKKSFINGNCIKSLFILHATAAASQLYFLYNVYKNVSWIVPFPFFHLIFFSFFPRLDMMVSFWGLCRLQCDALFL